MDSTPPDFWVCRGHNQPKTTWCLWQGGQAPSYQVLLEVSRPGHWKGKSTGVGSTQPSTAFYPTKSPGIRQLDTTVVREYRVGMWERGRGEMVMGWRERQADLAREVRASEGYAATRNILM